MKHLWNVCLILALVLFVLPMGALADDGQEPSEGAEEIEQMPASLAEPNSDYIPFLLGPKEKQSWQYKRGKELERVTKGLISTTSDSVVVADKDVAVGGANVYFGGKLLTNREDYTIKKEEDQVVVKFTKSYLAGRKPGKYNVYIEFSDRSVETTYELEDTDGYYTAEPPKTKKKS